MNSSKGHILVVDDSEMNRQLLGTRLEARGFEVSLAVDGPQALKMVAAQSFDLVLLDIIMPRMSGLEVLTALRQTHSRTELPVIIQTAKSDSATVVQSLRLGANDYITKGMEFDILLARLEAHLDIQQRARVSRRSGLTRLSGEEASEKQAHIFYCASCRSSLIGDEPSCPRCQKTRPLDGWDAVENSPYPLIGRIIGERYFLGRFLNRGSAASVYHARDLELNRQYAAKIVSLTDLPPGTSAQDVRERTRREVEVIAKLSNPHIVKLNDVVEVGSDAVALILDYVHGHSLEKILGRIGKLATSKSLDIVRQIAQGLYEAHQLGVVHCDIKPENIMIERLPVRGYFVHILDFGIAEILGYTRHKGHYTGTPLYSAPEQIRDDMPLDHRTDIYALGATLYHLLKGEPPYAADTSVEVLQAHLSAPIPRLAGPDEADSRLALIDELLAKMLAKSPDDRFDDLSEFIAYIDAIIPLTERHKS